MDFEKQKFKPSRFHRWFLRKNKEASAHKLEDSDDEGSDCLQGLAVDSLEIDPCISNNKLRIFVGTWNVAGRSPVGSLSVDLDEWLNIDDVADLYVLGFQEIVPLKTRNVIGAEDQTEATNWNMLIDKTLNNKYGCSMRNSFSNDHYNHNTKITDAAKRRKSFTDAAKRRKSFSAHPWISTTDHLNMNSSRIQTCDGYKLIASKKMVGVFISVWMKKELLRKYWISNVKVCSVACGIMGRLGNKGSVSVSMSIEKTSFCFVAAHLASGEKKGDEGRRNHQVLEIFRRTSFPRSYKDDHNHHPLTILGHDRIFWFGDLNYRLYLEDNLARRLIEKQDWKALKGFDQLQRELEDGGVFQGWKEGNIEFAPTYKYSSSNSNLYTSGLPSRYGEKQRIPAWCDRILWYGKGVKQLWYIRSESKFSDHRPVSALFSTTVEIAKATGPKRNSAEPILPSQEEFQQQMERCL